MLLQVQSRKTQEINKYNNRIGTEETIFSPYFGER